MSGLYQQAKARLSRQRKQLKVKAAAPQPVADPRRLVHELQVHQVELEMQNAELQSARDGMETMLERYTDLYDFAPVGYFTLAANCTVLQANLTGTRLVGIERSRLVGQLFGVLVAPELRPALHVFLKGVFADQAKHSGDFVLLNPGQPPRAVNIEAHRSPNGRECRVAVMDITERKQVEETVRISEVRYRRLFEAAHDGVLLLDSVSRKIIDANPFMTRLLDYPQEQLVGKELFEIGLLKDELASQEMFRKLKKSHEVRYEDLPLESRSGRHQEVEVVANLYQEGGHAVIQCNIRDITERKQTELALSRLAAIIEFSEDAIIGKDPQGVITSWNRGAESIFGYNASEMVGTSILKLIPADRLEEEKQILAKINRGESVKHMDTLRRTKSGRLINISLTTSPIKDAAGKVVGASKVARDISDRKQAENTLRRSEALFAELVARAPVGVYVVDARFKLQQVNPMALPVFINVQPLIGRDFSEVLQLLWPKRVAAQIVARFRHTLKTGVPYQSLEFAERRQDLGVVEHYDWQIQRVTLPAGEQGVVCFFSNITERKMAEATQRQMAVLTASNVKLEQEIVRRQAVEAALLKSQRDQAELLDQARLMQGQLRQLSRQVLRAQEEERKRISRELHDVIAQTLSGINVRLAALKKEAVHSTKGLDRSITSTQRMVKKSVEIVHEFARELRPAVLDDLGLIPALHSYLKTFIAQTGIHTRLTAFKAVEQLEDAKRTVLYRVAQEALTNVARHAHASRVDVVLKGIPTAARMEIRDNGKSFHAARLLQAQKGKRLGLLGMRERVEMVGGTFTVESTPGQGTTVCVEIPFSKSVRKPQAPPPPSFT